MYQTPYRRPARTGSYFLPFVSLIILGLIVVLIFQIVSYFREKRIQALENKTAVKILTGRAEMKIWGVDQWTTAIDGSILNEGDAIRTAPGSRVALELLNGSVARVSSESEVELTGLKTRDGQDEAYFGLKKGEIWIKRSEKEGVRASFKVFTPHLEITSMGTVFDTVVGEEEAVHVLDGKVQVVVKVEDPEAGNKMRVADTIEVALGQEISIGQSEINDLESRKPMALLALLSDNFRDSEWYVWNRREDANGGTGTAVADAVKQQEALSAQASVPDIATPEAQPEQSQPAQSESASTQEVSTALTTPEILTPKETERTSKVGTFEISGKVSPATEKLEIATYMGGKAEAYILQKYKAGSETWNYVAANQYNNLAPGENKFTITAIGKDGTRSDPATLTLVYDRPKEPADLSAPTVLKFNDSDSSETTEDSVKVSGKIGKGIAKVWVNDFALGQYVMNSETWAYYAKTVYGNLKEGVNEYSVYGVDFDGNKTPVTKFVITKKAKPVEEPPPPAAPTEAPAPTPMPSPEL
ncbi:MAG: FecR family protein [Patescibacteria group bacterium]